MLYSAYANCLLECRRRDIAAAAAAAAADAVMRFLNAYLFFTWTVYRYVRLKKVFVNSIWSFW